MGINKVLFAGVMFSIFFILMSPLSNSEPVGYQIIGDTVQWENSYGKLVVFPHTSYGLTEQTQYANITSYLTGSFDFAFEFENSISGKIYLWQNISHSVKIYDLGNITNYLDCVGEYGVNYDFINSSWGWCNYTDVNSTEIYWEHYFDWYNTNSSGIRIFWNVTGIIGSHYEDQYWFDWNDKTGLFEHDTYNGRHFYWIKNVNFQENETKQVKWTYTTSINTNGKWQLWIKRNQDTIQEAISNGFYVKLDPWWNSNWDYKKNITFSGSTTTENLDDFPILVNLTSANFDFSKAQDNGEDIRFLDSDETTALDYEIELWDNTIDNAVIWVKVPRIEANNITDFIYMYYGNDGATDGQNPPGVWSNNYLAVLHMKGDGTTLLVDSLDVYNFTKKGVGEPANIPDGKIEGGQYFGGSDNDASQNTLLDVMPSDVIISLWIKPTSGWTSAMVGNEYFLFKENTGVNTLYSWFQGSDGRMVTANQKAGVETNLATIKNSWLAQFYYISFHYGTGGMKIYVDGVLDNSNAVTTLPNTGTGSDYYINSVGGVVQWTNCSIDEFRMSNVTRSGDWIMAQWKSQNNTLITFGIEETPTPANTTPTVSLYNITGSTTDATPSIDFNYTDDDLSATCYLLFNGTAYDVNVSTVNATQTTLTANATLSLDDYEVKVSCNDGQATGTSSPITLSIMPFSYLYIIINSPENKTYSSLTIPFSVTFSGLYVVDTVIYELNGINTTVYPNTTEIDDTEDAYDCWGTFNGGYECSKAVDEDWTTGAMGHNGEVYENFTIPDGMNEANLTTYFQGLGSYTSWIYYWNYTLNEWQVLEEIYEPNGNYTNTIPFDGKENDIIRIKTRCRYGSPNDYVRYMEGMMTWASNLPNEITAQDGSNNLIVWGNNTQGVSNSSQVVFSVIFPPSIDQVNVPSASLDPVEKSTTNVAINFTATGTYLDNTSAKFVLLNGATSYTDTVCEVTAIDSNTNRYNCDINLNYYDGAGVWTVNVSINNNTGDGLVYNDTETITYNSLTALQTNSSTLSFGTFNRASSLIIDTNQLENTGNVNLTEINITGYDLRGVTDISQFLYLSDSIFAIRQEGESYSDLINVTQVTVTNGVIDLYPSQYTNLDFKITPANIPAINKAQQYQTETGLEWVISV